MQDKTNWWLIAPFSEQTRKDIDLNYQLFGGREMLITPDKKTKSLIIAKNIVAEAKDKFPLCVYLKTQLSPEERELIEKECYITTLSEDNVGYTLYSILWNEKQHYKCEINKVVR